VTLQRGDVSASTPALWSRYRANGEPAVRRELIERYIGLVHHHAREVARRTRELELDELISAGTVGLIQALEGFDPSRGLAFSTYAMPRIRGAMLDELRRHDWMPRTLRARTRQMEAARARLRQKLGGEPAPEQVAEALEIDLETYWRWARESEGAARVSLDPGDGEHHDDRSHGEVVADATLPEIDSALIDRETRRALHEEIAALPERDRLVLSLSYFEQLSLREIGEVLHITESRVSQVRTRALQRLREALRQREAA
jgi:RNA polymerase sigma factor for flagellar operon FliA